MKATRRARWADFEIPKPIIQALKENELEKPLPIQTKTLKATLIDDKHVLGAARTGSGKTLAYAIPLVTRILNNQSHPCSILKRKLAKKYHKEEDFELIDGETIEVEDMIVDNLSNQDSSDSNSEEDEEHEEMSEVTNGTSSLKSSFSCPEAIVLVPTRELAYQVKGEFDRLCSKTNITSCCVIGGLSSDKQKRILRNRKPEIIIATPGRLYDIIQDETVPHLDWNSVASIRTLIIDEADRMIQKGHFQEMLHILEAIKKSFSFRDDIFSYRVLMFSATLTFLHELPERFKTAALDIKETRDKKSKKQVDVKEHNIRNKIKHMLALLGIQKSTTRIIDLNDEMSHGRPSSDQLIERKMSCTQDEKDLCLYYFIIQNPNKRTLVFCNSKDCLRRLTNVLKFLKIDALTLHAEMDQKKRLSSLEKFRLRPDAIMIATDVAARGLDIKDLDCVVHYQVPKTCESYIHRSGRTARLFKKGISLTLLEPKETVAYKRLCNNINGGKDIEEYEIEIDIKKLLRDRVVLAQQCDIIDHQLRVSKSDHNWFVKAAKNCEIELDEDQLETLSGRGKSRQENNEQDAKKRRHLALLQKQLGTLLKRPLVTRATLVKKAALRAQEYLD